MGERVLGSTRAFPSGSDGVVVVRIAQRASCLLITTVNIR